MTNNEHEESLWLSAHIDGALSAGETARVEAHLKACASCRFELAALRETKNRLRLAPRRALPPDLLAELEAMAEPSRARVWAGALRLGEGRRWVPAAATGAVLALGLWFGVFRHGAKEDLPIEALAAAHSRYSAEGLIPGDLVASNFSEELAQFHNEN